MVRQMTSRNYLLLTPGPLTNSRTVKEAMLFDSCTWDDDYNLGVVQTIRQQLVQLATPADGYTAVLLQGSGSYAVEAVLGSVIGEQGKVLIVSNGAYGARMIEMAQLMGIACHPYDCGEVSRPDAAAIEQILQNDPAITHIAMVHSETTTGMLNPIEEVAELAKRYDKRYIVDAMSSFGGIPLDIAALNIDYLISSANKCIQGVPGFAFVIAREAEQYGIDLRLCGEMAGDPMCVAILIGLGFRHLSMNGRSVARVKYLLRHIEQDEARELAARSLEAQLAAEVRHQVAAFMERRGMGGLIRGGR